MMLFMQSVGGLQSVDVGLNIGVKIVKTGG
jgi:hypothetical protein